MDLRPGWMLKCWTVTKILMYNISRSDGDRQQNLKVVGTNIETKEYQTHPDPDMPLRVIGYDGAEYRAQLNDKSHYPVITLVLYFGYEKHWGQPLSLKACMEIPPEFDRYVNDYKVNLFEIAYLPKEKAEMFQSDFRIVADYFIQKREHGDYIPSPQNIQHVQETLQLLSVMTRDHRFEEVCNQEAKGGIRNMCDVLDRIELKGRQEGRREGRQEGRQEGLQEGQKIAKREMAVSLASMGFPMEKIAEAAKVDVEIIKQWIAEEQ